MIRRHELTGREWEKPKELLPACFNRLKRFRGLATRYDKTTGSYQAVVTLASLSMWL